MTLEQSQDHVVTLSHDARGCATTIRVWLHNRELQHAPVVCESR